MKEHVLVIHESGGKIHVVLIDPVDELGNQHWSSNLGHNHLQCDVVVAYERSACSTTEAGPGDAQSHSICRDCVQLRRVDYV